MKTPFQPPTRAPFAPLNGLKATLFFGLLALCGAAQSASATDYAGGAVSISVSGNGDPYPSTITVPDVGTVGSVEVSLNGLIHDFLGDFDIVLEAPNGKRSVLISDVGDSEATNTGVSNVTYLISANGAPIPDAAPPPSGTYQPTNFAGFADISGSPEDVAGTVTDLSTFNGGPTNGTWKLFVFDDVDEDGGSLSSWTLKLGTRQNQAPTLDPTIKPSTPGPNDLVITDPRGTDPENDPLTFTFAYAINGTTVAGETDKPNRVDLSKYPALATPGAVLTVTFTAFDGTNTTMATRNVTIQAPPVANAASGSAMAGVQSVIGPITGSDPNGLTLRYVLLTQPTSGSAFLAGSANNVQLYYTSARGFSGADSVTFQVVNSEGRRSDPATISITVQGNGAPTAGNNSMTVKAGVRTEIPLVASDPDGDELRYRISRQPANGSAFLANNTSGGVSLFYTGNPTYSGADSVQFTATDPSGATSAPGTISLTVVGNSAPTADNTTLDAISGERASVLLSGNDADGDALVRYRIVSQPSNGSAFLAGSGNNVQLYYTSNAGYVGSDSAQFTVTDSTGRASAPATVSITVSPAPNAAKNSGGLS